MRIFCILELFQFMLLLFDIGLKIWSLYRSNPKTLFVVTECMEFFLKLWYYKPKIPIPLDITKMHKWKYMKPQLEEEMVNTCLLVKEDDPSLEGVITSSLKK